MLQSLGRVVGGSGRTRENAQLDDMRSSLITHRDAYPRIHTNLTSIVHLKIDPAQQGNSQRSSLYVRPALAPSAEELLSLCHTQWADILHEQRT
jgi:hypothetical protein